MSDTITLQAMLTAAGTTDPDLLARAFFEVSGHSANFDGQPAAEWKGLLPQIRAYVSGHADREKDRRNVMADQQLATFASRPQRRADYEAGLKRAGIDPPDPVVVSLRGYVADGYHKAFAGPVVRDGISITGATFKDHKAPSGVTYRNVCLYTHRMAIKPPFIDALINGVPVLLEWNGRSGNPALGAVEWTARELTEDEANTIETWREGA